MTTDEKLAKLLADVEASRLAKGIVAAPLPPAEHLERVRQQIAGLYQKILDAACEKHPGIDQMLAILIDKEAELSKQVS
jgi:hypothetical protein